MIRRPATLDELYNLAVDDDRAAYRASLDALVTVSASLSCGHRWRPGRPVRAAEAISTAGYPVICDVCDDHAILVRVTTRLVEDGGRR